MVRIYGLFFATCYVFAGFFSISAAVEPAGLFSENTASIFIKQASEVYSEGPLEPQNIEQAMTFLEGAYALNPSSPDIPEQMLRVMAGGCYTGVEYSTYFNWALSRYLGSRADLEIATGALRCMLEGINTRVEREALLDQLIRRYSDSNPILISDLTTQLGLLVAEKADKQTALTYLSAAYRLNPFNQLAYSKYMEISADLEDSSIALTTQLLHLRRLLSVNPYDLETAMLYADNLQRLQIYNVASDAYEYAADIFHFLYPDQPLSKEILHPWLLSTYHSGRNRPNCLKIAEQHRDANRFDLVLESIVGKTLIRLGQVEAGNRTLKEATRKAEKLASADRPDRTVLPEYLSWFYSFISPHPENALAWSNEAFQEDPNRPGVNAIFAYSLALNGQDEKAMAYAEPAKETDQIASLTVGMIQLSDGQKQAALETLKATAAMSPETFIAEQAIRLLKDHGSDYIPEVLPGSVQEDLENAFRFGLVPDFIDSSERFTAKLLFNGSDFLYGEDFPARLVIENTSSEPLVISDDGLLKGNLRVDAVLEGNLNVEIDNLLTKKFRPSETILPGKYTSVSLDLNCGRLRKLLLTYPQADVWINFHVTLDSPLARFESEAPSFRARIHRRGVEMTRDFLIQRLDVLSKGQLGQKYQAASLFVGLLAEQAAFELSQADFTHIQVERALLVDSVRKILTDQDWKIRVHALNCLLSVSLPLEHGIVNEVSNNLNHEKWPVRLMAMYLLAKSQPGSFRKVLDWTAEHDSYAINRTMAVALGGREQTASPANKEPETQE